MTPKQLLEAHNGDPLAAADGLDANGAGDEKDPKLPLLNLYLAHRLGHATKFTIARLGEDGAEKWGRALAEIVLGADCYAPTCDIWHVPSFQLTRIANATDRERLAACIVALAEVEKC